MALQLHMLIGPIEDEPLTCVHEHVGRRPDDAKEVLILADPSRYIGVGAAMNTRGITFQGVHRSNGVYQQVGLKLRTLYCSKRKLE